ncbi:hypothetical protein PYCC9005_000802 [Savitreella phatthalungensis]
MVGVEDRLDSSRDNAEKTGSVSPPSMAVQDDSDRFHDNTDIAQTGYALSFQQPTGSARPELASPGIELTQVDEQKHGKVQAKGARDTKLGLPSTLSMATNSSNDSIERETRPSAKDAKLAVASAWLAFFVFGTSDGAIGACLIYMQSYYDITYTKVSLVFLLQVLGYGAMSFLNNSLLNYVGRRWSSLFGNMLLVIGFSIIAAGPPFAAVAVAFVMLGFAAGVYESMYNAFLGTFRESAVLLGCLHGFYGLGAAVSPILATQMIVHGITWHYYYFLLLGLGIVNVIIALPGMWRYTPEVMQKDISQAKRLRQEMEKDILTAASTIEIVSLAQLKKPTAKSSISAEPGHDELVLGTPLANVTTAQASTLHKRSILRRAFSERFCLVGAAYMFLYLGLEIGTGGWIVAYLHRIRGGSESAMGFVNSGYWLGLTASRFLLAVPSDRLGHWYATQLWMALALVFVLVFWLAKPVAAASTAVCLMGFMIGPTFPNIMSLATKNLPEDLHVAGIGVVASMGSVGGAVLPFLIGILATAKSPKVVPYVLTALNIGCLIVWTFLPGREVGPLLRRYKFVSDKLK